MDSFRGRRWINILIPNLIFLFVINQIVGVLGYWTFSISQ